MNIENMDDKSIENLENMNQVLRNQTSNFEQHYGSHESRSNSDIELDEKMKKMLKEEIKPTIQNYGSVENMSESDIKTLEAQIYEKRQSDIPYKEYLTNIIKNPFIYDEKQFEEAVLKSMQSNKLMVDFITEIINKISEKTYEIKNLNKDDISNINKLKNQLEQLVILYQRYLYKLKEHSWDFQNLSGGLEAMKIPSEVKEILWKFERNNNITFTMPIPADLGEYYGGKFERKGKMIPGLQLMYDDLANQKVNWHQVIIYNENELTPHQKYIQNQEILNNDNSSRSM